MIPPFEQVQAILWDRKQKGDGGAIVTAVGAAEYCEGCSHHTAIHRGGACAFYGCECPTFVGRADFRARVVQAAVEVAAEGWDGG